MFKEIIKRSKATNVVAHLCPPTFIGSKSCERKRLINWAWRVKKRLVAHRGAGEGKKYQGISKAKAIKGMPKRTGDKNWSKRLVIMVRFRCCF